MASGVPPWRPAAAPQSSDKGIYDTTPLHFQPSYEEQEPTRSGRVHHIPAPPARPRSVFHAALPSEYAVFSDVGKKAPPARRPHGHKCDNCGLRFVCL
jgi:hypothetical protein